MECEFQINNNETVNLLVVLMISLLNDPTENAYKKYKNVINLQLVLINMIIYVLQDNVKLNLNFDIQFMGAHRIFHLSDLMENEFCQINNNVM